MINHSELRKFLKSLFINSLNLNFESKIYFFAVFDWYFASWIRIRIQEATILRIQRIRILSTDKNTSQAPTLASGFLILWPSSRMMYSHCRLVNTSWWVTMAYSKDKLSITECLTLKDFKKWEEKIHKFFFNSWGILCCLPDRIEQ